MAKINYNKIPKRYASYEPQRQLALKLQRKENIPASDKQVAFMKRLGAEFPANVTKRQASFIIDSALQAEKSLQKIIKNRVDRER